MAVMTPTTLTNLVIYTVIPTGLGFLFWYAFRLKKGALRRVGRPQSTFEWKNPGDAGVGSGSGSARMHKSWRRFSAKDYADR